MTRFEPLVCPLNTVATNTSLSLKNGFGQRRTDIGAVKSLADENIIKVALNSDYNAETGRV